MGIQHASVATVGGITTLLASLVGFVILRCLLESLLYLFRFRAFSLASSKGWRPWTWYYDAFRAVFYTRDNTSRGYQTHSTQGRIFVQPSIMAKPELIFPKSYLKSLLSYPDNVLSFPTAMEDNLQAEYTLKSLHPTIVHNQWHTLPAKAMSVRAHRFVASCAEEISVALDDYFGLDQAQWSSVPVMATMSKLAVRSSSRYVLGVPLCRNESLVNSVVDFGFGTFSNAALIRLLPDWLQRIFGNLIASRSHKHHANYERHVKSLVEKKIEMTLLDKKQESLPTTDDMLQWHIDYARTFSPEDELTADLITKRILLFTIGAMVTPAMGLTHLVFNLYSADTPDLIDELRDEILTVMQRYQGQWSIEALNKMCKLDSAIKESLRISCFGTRVCARRVLAPKGVTLQDGTHLPHGATVCIPQWQVHHDETIYTNAHKYEPMRFYKPNSSSGIAATTPEYLAFGIGKHACPGRAFASIELKLAAALMILNYDVFPIERKPNSWVGPSHLPRMESIKVKRRCTTMSENKVY